MVSFFISKNFKKYLIISFISLIISLYLFEIYLTLKYQYFKEQKYEKQTGIKWDKRTKFEIYKDLNIIGNYVSDIGLSYYIKYKESDNFLPFSGISYSKTIHCNENGYFSIYDSDRYGFNNPDEEWDNEEIEYLLVGDSFTHGNCVNRPNDISSVLRGLSNKHVLNLGYEYGRGPLLEYASLREYGSSNVKKVVWLYFEGNDLEDLEYELSINILKKYLENSSFSQNLRTNQNLIDDLAKKILEIEKKKARSYFKLEFIKMRNLRELINPRKRKLVSPPLLEFKKILELTKDLTAKNNSELYFVYLPEYNRYKKGYNNTNYNLVKNIVNQLEIFFIDIDKEVFNKEHNPLKLFPFEMNGHYNEEGYKKISEAIYKITKN